MKSVEVKKVIWAVDVFTDIPEIEELAVKSMLQFLKSIKSTAQIFPVCVYPGISNDVEAPFARAELVKRLSKFKIKRLEPVKVITTGIDSSISEQVSVLLRYSKKSGADLILATTHGRKGLSQLLLGSFSYELISQTSIPLFIIDPKCEFHKKISRILFPVGYDGLEQGDGKYALDLTKKISANLTIYQHVKNLIALDFDKKSDFVEVSLSRGGKMNVMKGADKVKIETEVDSRTTKKSVVEYLKKENFDLVLLSGKAKEIKEIMPHGISKYIIQNSSCPVLMI